MSISTIAQIGQHENESVTIRGWLYNLRESGKLLFPQFRDESRPPDKLSCSSSEERPQANSH